MDTSVTAAISLYGYYGPLDADERTPFSTPLAYVGPGAPPFFVAHGDQDMHVPVEGARLFVDRLRSTSSSPVVSAELPGAQHSFDLFHSLRFEAVVNAIEAFAEPPGCGRKVVHPSGSPQVTGAGQLNPGGLASSARG